MSSLSGLRVVVADDNENMRNIIAAILKAAGIGNIVASENGYEAIRAIHRTNPDMAIVDFNMQPVDGIEFTRYVRSSPMSANPHLPILMMTGHAEKGRVLEARKAGISEFVVKPLTARRLLARFNRLLSSEAFARHMEAKTIAEERLAKL